jgi:hypothetical protein
MAAARACKEALSEHAIAPVELQLDAGRVDLSVNRAQFEEATAALTARTLQAVRATLRDAGLSASRKEGKWSYHRLTPLGQSVTEAFFGVFPSVLATDARLRRDQARLERRLALRDEADQCCVGSQCRSMGSRSMESQDRKGFV